MLSSSDYDGGIAVVNDLNNTLFIDDNYLATGNAAGISGNAMWANPRSGFPLGDPKLQMTFEGFFWDTPDDGLIEEVSEIEFNFAWASTDVDASLDTLEIEIMDYDYNFEYVSIPLDDTFFHSLNGGGTGYEGLVRLVPESVSNIFHIRFLNIHDASPEGHVGEIAIDNLRVNGSGEEETELGPVSFDGSPLTSYGTNALKGTGVFSISDSVFNGTSSPTTFTVLWESSNPALYQTSPVVNRLIAPGATDYGAVSWSVNRATTPSGTYTGKFTIINDGNNADPDNEVQLNWFRLFDPPELSDNSGGTTIVPGGVASISNAAVLPHAGALRASVRVTEQVLSNPRFSATGIPANGRLDAGQTFNGSFAFNASGAPSGVHTGQYRMKLAMASPLESYLNQSVPVSDRVWNLSYTVPTVNLAAATVAPGENLADAGLGISGPESGAAVADGVSPVEQEVSITFNNNPPMANPTGFGSAVSVNFSVSASIYVLQLSYASLPAGSSIEDLQIEAYSGGGSWVPAISLNGNGGTTVAEADPFHGSYNAYLAAVGGGVLDAGDVGAFGVDGEGKTAWVIVDYQGLFQITSSAPPLPSPPQILGFSYDATSNTATISYQSVLGATFTVHGGGSPNDTGIIGPTDTGTGNIMEYSHHPPGAPSRYFYHLSRP